MRRYIEEVGFPFDILIDETRDVTRAYGVWHRIGIAAWNIARPAQFVIDRDRTILAAIKSEIRMNVHADKALEVLRGAAA